MKQITKELLTLINKEKSTEAEKLFETLSVEDKESFVLDNCLKNMKVLVFAINNLIYDRFVLYQLVVGGDVDGVKYLFEKNITAREEVDKALEFVEHTEMRHWKDLSDMKKLLREQATTMSCEK